MFTQLSFTPNDNTSFFGNSNIFGGNKVTSFATANDEPKVTNPADEVKKNFSFANALKPSVFGQNIFGQSAMPTTSLTATFGNNTTKPAESTTAANSFSFEDAMRTTSTNPPAVTSTPAANVFSFGKFLVE